MPFPGFQQRILHIPGKADPIPFARFDNPAARDLAWSFIKESWSEIEPKLRIAFGEGRVVSAVGAFCDAGTRDDIKSFFAAHPLPTAARQLGETLERIDNCIALKQRQTPLVTEWLGSR